MASSAAAEAGEARRQSWWELAGVAAAMEAMMGAVAMGTAEVDTGVGALEEVSEEEESRGEGAQEVAAGAAGGRDAPEEADAKEVAAGEAA